MIGTALAIASLAGSAFGAVKSGQANRQTTRMLEQRKTDLDAWFNNEFNQDYLNTAEGASTLSALKTSYNDMQKKTGQGNAVMGKSDESRIASSKELGQRYLQAISNLAGRGTYRKDMIQRQYAGRDDRLSDMFLNNQENQAQNWTNFSNNAMNAGIGFAGVEGSGAFDTWDLSLKKAFNNRNPISKVSTSNIKMPTLAPKINKLAPGPSFN